MILRSTAGQAPDVDLPTALFRGLAPDGGLYVPARVDPLRPDVISEMRGRPLTETAMTLGRHLLGAAVEKEPLWRIVREALDFPIPLVRLQGRVHVLELFHGPTLAFKDVGARFLARLMAHFREDAPKVLAVLVATSGDTGGAVADAFVGLKGTRVFVLYPVGGVSPTQERLFTTRGGNVVAVSVEGTFDDCQRLVKGALTDPGLRDRCDLTSANSINVGRFLPQIFYYFHAWAQLTWASPDPIISVPSGNLGNLAAGLLAKRLGLPVGRFVAATNVNDVVPEYLSSGRYQPRPSIATLSSAMDVGDPSNFARIQDLYDKDLGRLRADLEAHSYTDEATREAVVGVFQRTGYLLDPHSAVGLLGLGAALGKYPEAPGIALATAHPAKFREALEPLIGGSVPLPDRLTQRMEGEPRVDRISPEPEALRDILTETG